MAIKYLSGVTVDSTVLVVDAANDRVGIGTASPDFKLHLVGGSQYINGGQGGVVNSSPYTSANRLIFNNDYNDVARGPNKITLYDGTWLGGFGVHDNTLAYYSGGIHNWYQATTATNAVSLMTLTSSGSLGIGTTSPYAKLHSVITSNGFNPSLTYNTSAAAIVENWGVQLAMGVDTVNSQTFYLQARQSANTSWPMSLNPLGGNVGIGTTSPGFKLDVFGDARFGDGNNFNPLIQFAGSGRVAASPGYSFVGDLDTGMFNPNLGNTLAFTTAGSERLRIDSAGNVGINTTSPSAPLEITNTGSAGGGYSMFNAYYSAAKQWGMRKYGIDNGTGIAFSSDVQFASTWYSATRIGHGQNANNPSFQSYYTTYLATTSGNVGIGTTSPNTKLQVSALNSNYVNLTGGLSVVKAEEGYGMYMGVASSGNSWIQSATYDNGITYPLILNSAGGNVGIGTTSPATKLDVNGGINIANGNNLTWGGTYAAGIPTIVGYNAGTGGALYFYPNGSTSGEKMRLHASGNLSIGNTNDTYKLDVSGTGRFLDNLIVNKEDGIIGIDANNNPRIGFVKKSGLQPFLAFSTDPFLLRVSSGSEVFASNTFTTVLSVATSGAATFSSSVTASSLIKSGGTSVQYLMADGSTSTIASANVYTQTFFVPNTSGTAQWTKLGTWTAAQGGNVVTVQIDLHNGYNAATSQNKQVYIYMKTSNTNSVDANGFAADSTFWTEGLNTSIIPGDVIWESNAAGVSATTYTLYVFMAAYSLSSQYTVTTRGGTWANVETLTAPSATTGSSTILLSENRFVVNNVLTVGGSSSGNVLIGTTADVGYKLDVAGTGRFTSHVSATLISANNGDGFRVFASTATAGGSQPGIGYYTVGGSKRFTNQLDVSGDTWGVVGTTGTNYLLIAQSGAATFSSSVTASSLIKSGGTSVQYLMADGSVSTLTNPVTGTGTTNYVPKWTSGSAIGNSLIFDDGTNVGIGVTPSAWSVVTPTLQIGAGGAFIGGQGSANVVRVGINTYYDGSVWRYVNTGSASWFETASGAFGWFNAASGTAGGVATIGNLMTLTAGGNLGIGTTSPREKLQVVGNTVIGSAGLNSYKTNLYLTYSASTDETWVRIYLPQDYASSNNGGTVKVRVLWEGDHATFGAYQEYQISYKTYYPATPYLKFSNVLCTNKTSDFSTGSTYYPPSSTPDVLFYDNTDGYLYVKVKGTNTAYNTSRYIEAEIFGRTTAQPTIATTTAPGAPVELTKTIQFLPQEGNIYASGSVGIGTTAPDSLLHISGSGNTFTRYTNTTSAGHYIDIGANGAGQSFVYGYGAYPLLFATNGSEAMRITSAGNVGIGTTAPGALLQVGLSNSTSDALLRLGVIYDGSRSSRGGITWHDASNTTGKIYTEYDGTTVSMVFGSLYNSGYNSNQLMIIRGNGNVGIGTTSPASLLTVNGLSANTESGQIKIIKTGANEQTLHIGYNTTSDYAYLNAYKAGLGYKPISLNPDGGNVGIGNTAPNQKLEISVGNAVTGGLRINHAASATSEGMDITYLNTGATTTSFDSRYNSDSAVMQFRMKTAATAVNAMTILGSGNVGIGTTAPGYKLEVSGNSYFSGLAHFGQTATTGSAFRWGSLGTAVSPDTMLCMNQLWNGSGWTILDASFGTTAINLGSAQASPTMRFETGGANTVATTKMIILNNGNVGIGTTGPAHLLSIYGTPVSDGALNVVQKISSNAASSTIPTSGLGFGANYTTGGDNAVLSGIAGGKENATSGDFAGVLTFYTRPNGGNHTERMRITSAGNVGIGTTGPTAKLQVVGTSTYNSDAVKAFRVSDSTTITKAVDIGFDAALDAGFIQAGNFGVAYRHLLLQPNDNSVGIGTTAPSEKLHVDGSTLITYNNSFQSTNSVGNKAILARVSPTSGIINYAEYATATNLNGFVIGSDDARVKGNITGDSLEFITNTSTRMTVLSSGNVGINTTTPGSTLHVVGDVLIQTGALGVGVNPNATDGRIDASNDIVAFSTSDKRLKENITPIANALEKVRSLTGVEFDWKEETKSVHGYEGHDVGVIAQDVQAVLPEAVRTNDSGYLSVRYEKMIALLIEANKELANRVEQLEKLIK